MSRKRERDETTADTPERLRASARATLLTYASRAYPAALVCAGRLLAAHGDGARRELAREWSPGWPAAFDVLDELLEKAGVPGADVLL